jgi:hypothetical protein
MPDDRPQDDADEARTPIESPSDQARRDDSSDGHTGLDEERAPPPEEGTERESSTSASTDSALRENLDEGRAPRETTETPDTADRTRELAQAQAERLRADAQHAEGEVTRTLDEVAQQHGGELVGLEHNLKEIPSLTDKITRDASLSMESDPEQQVQDAAEGIKDALRYTAQADTETYMDTYRGVVQSLAERGYQRIESDGDNRWAEPGSEQAGPYRGINSTWETPDGQRFELQFHTPESFAAKTENHPLYERVRDPSTPPAEAAELNDIMTRRCDQIPVPPGAVEDRDRG